MDEEAAFDKFAQHKNYHSKEEYAKRFAVYKENVAFVRKWNAEGHSFQVGINEMADLTDDEFAREYLNPTIHNEYVKSESFLAAEEAKAALTQKKQGSRAEVLADVTEDWDIRWHKNTGQQLDEVDWHAKGAVTAVNNQAKCFACYAFAACGAIESATFITTGKMKKLSAQQIVDCSRQKYKNHGCKGGTMVKSYKYIVDNGVMQAVDYGYDRKLNSMLSCKTTHSTCNFKTEQVQQKIAGYVNVRAGDEVDLKNAVSMRPVSVAIDAHHRAFKLYRSGVFSLSSCTTHLTHGVLMVGYGTEKGTDYWLIKNSWGTQWGQQGFGKVIRGKNMCSIADWSNYPILSASDDVSAVRSVSEL